MQVQSHFLTEETHGIHASGSKYTKIGEIGRIDWFKSGKVFDLQETDFPDTRIQLKIKLQGELIKLRDSLQLDREVKHIQVTIVLICILVILWVFFSKFFQANLWVYLSVYLILQVGLIVYVFSISNRMFQKVKSGIQILNRKLIQEGYLIYFELKKETCRQRWGHVWNRMNFVEVFQYNNDCSALYSENNAIAN